MLKDIGLSSPRVKVVVRNDIAAMSDMLLSRGPSGLELGISPRPHRSVTRAKAVPFLYYFSQCDLTVTQVTCNTSDGNLPSEARFSYSSFSEHVIPLPDLYFFQSGGYSALRDLVSKNPKPWHERSGDIVWRGAPNGNGYLSFAPEIRNHPTLRQRIRMAWICRDSEVDFRFVFPEHEKDAAVAQRAGFVGTRIPSDQWIGKKYAIDIDGFSNAWDNFYHRLLMGCCVLKVQSDFGFRQWYYGELKPFVHYVPVKADMSDFFEKVDWVRSNPQQAGSIASAGQAMANSLTFESEIARAAPIDEAICLRAMPDHF